MANNRVTFDNYQSTYHILSTNPLTRCCWQLSIKQPAKVLSYQVSEHHDDTGNSNRDYCDQQYCSIISIGLDPVIIL